MDPSHAASLLAAKHAVPEIGPALYDRSWYGRVLGPDERPTSSGKRKKSKKGGKKKGGKRKGR